MAKILDCKLVAEAIINDCKAEAANLKEKGISPKLAILRVGENGPDLSYEKGIFAITNTIGIDVEIHAMPANISQEDYILELEKLNSDPSIHGILPFRPLENIDEVEAISNHLSSMKDCDGSTAENMGKVVLNDPTALAPCSAAAILEIIRFYSNEIKAISESLNVCIVNNSNVIGKPLAMMLANRFASVTCINRSTPDDIKIDLMKRANILVCATTSRNSITADMIGENAVVIDAAIIREDKIYGCCSTDVFEKAAYMTPVPGIGRITSALLMKNLIKACKIQNNII